MNENDKGEPSPRPADEASKQRRGEMSWNQAVIVGGLAISLPGMLFGPPVFGMILDDHFGTSPWFTLGMLVMGFIATVYNVFLILRKVKLME